MDIVREPEGVDFIVSSGRWTPEESTEAAVWLEGYRQGRNAVLSSSEIVDAAMMLPPQERIQLIQTLTESMVTFPIMPIAASESVRQMPTQASPLTPR